MPLKQPLRGERTLFSAKLLIITRAGMGSQSGHYHFLTQTSLSDELLFRVRAEKPESGGLRRLFSCSKELVRKIQNKEYSQEWQAQSGDPKLHPLT